MMDACNLRLFGRLKQENWEFKASLDSILRPCLKRMENFLIVSWLLFHAYETPVLFIVQINCPKTHAS